MMNSRVAALKYSSYDNSIQRYLISNICIQVFLSIVLASCYVLWLKKHPILFEIIDSKRASNGSFFNWMLSFVTWMLMMT